MHLPAKSKMEKVVSKDTSVPILCQPFLRVEPDGTGTLLASDKFTALVIPVELGDTDTSGPVPLDAIKNAQKMAGGVVRCEPGYCVLPNAVAYPRDDAKYSEFPPVDQLLVDPADAVVEVAINIKSLYALAQAMGTEVVTLRVQADPANLPVGVEPHPSAPHVPGARAALMPYRIPGSV